MQRTAPSVLIVDDCASFLHGLKRLFRMEGCSVMTCESAEEAEAFAIDRKFDVALLDVNLPIESGDILAKKLIAKKTCGKIVFMTSDTYCEAQLKQQIPDAQVIIKPISINDILHLVHAANPNLRH